MTKKTIAIIGAGIIGVTTAYLLKRAGYRIILIDAEDGPALKTSFANGCQLSYSYIDAISSPSLIKKLPKIIAGMDPAFRIKLSPDPNLVTWGSQFVINAQNHKEEFNTQTLLRLSLYSRSVLHSLLAESNFEFAHRASGKLLIYTNQEELNKATIRVNQKAEWGCKQEVLNDSQCLDLEPSLQQLSQPIVGGIYSSIDEIGNPHRLSCELLEIMKGDKEFEAHFNCRVNRIVKRGYSIQSLETSNGAIHADAYVLATGPESLNLAREIGIKLPIYPIKGYSITVPATEFAPEVCVTDVDNKVVISRIGNQLRIAGCADIVGYKSNIDESRIEHLLNICKKNFPKAGVYSDIIHTWTGLRPVTPSSVPIIGKTGVDNLFLNVGHGALGWTLALGSASLLTAIIDQQPPPIDTTGMSPKDHGIS
ncbi:FAD-dependent oxidoreductase [Vibrio sinensis]|uniref:FAD-dependent oxidoreductase n=1 Tax=Vibrio sinensis TaxID=2302434 RepID=A0A3A6QUK1_9VIBR|nr:D-amino acid dehydrogenase [Vibrio sinensis]RJX74286.1 FAD-dependent oxidoreductase [Vibrio sinensis]